MNNYAFIDSQNLHLSILEQGWSLDFRKFRVYLADKLEVTKAFIFIGYVAENESLYLNLQKYGYLLVFKPTLRPPRGKIKGNVDPEIILHTMIEWPNYDKAVIVTGDGDFFCLVDYLTKKDKLQKLVIPNRDKYSSLYRKSQQYILFLSGLREKLEYKR